jgi:hypothetical protein
MLVLRYTKKRGLVLEESKAVVGNNRRYLVIAKIVEPGARSVLSVDFIAFSVIGKFTVYLAGLADIVLI